MDVQIPVTVGTLEGTLDLPTGAAGLVIFAHGSGSSRHSPRNRRVARRLRADGLGTLLLDLLTPSEGAIDQRTADLRFDVPLLAGRLLEAAAWARERGAPGRLLGYFGASTGAAAALVAAADEPGWVAAIVSRGGRPDLAGDALARVAAPTLLIVGSRDEPVLALNRQALAVLGGLGALEIVPGATHLFEEPGTLEQVAALAAGWFGRHLRPSAAAPA